MYEMDLRQYDAAIARWVAQDPVIHYDFSPYSAFDNNPVFWADPSGADAVKITDANGNVVGGSFNGQDKDNLYNYLVGNTDNFEAELRDFYSFESNKNGNGGGNGNGNGNGGGKNKGANNRGIGTNNWQKGLAGMSGYTFFGAPVRLIPFDTGMASYFGGAINIYIGTWKEYLKDGLDSPRGRLLMHEYGHYLQEKYGGIIKYYGIVPYKSMGTINESSEIHASNWVELQANTLAYYYFGTPEKFISNNSKIDYFSIYHNYIKISPEILFQIQNGYLQHPDYKQ